jgi:hypothetical protein
MPSVITQEHIKKGISYSDYQHRMITQVLEKKTSGKDQSEKLVEYTALNNLRMERIEKTGKLKPEMIELLISQPHDWYWIVLTETWCGDAAQNIPYLAKMADMAPSIELLFLFRDENPEVMDAYLTNNSKSIPKLICLHRDNLKELGTWGPRPAPAQQMVMEYRALPEPKEPYSEFTKQVQMWYNHDKGETLQNEFMELIQQWSRIII